MGTFVVAHGDSSLLVSGHVHDDVEELAQDLVLLMDEEGCPWHLQMCWDLALK